MTADDVKVGQRVDVLWGHNLYPTPMTVAQIHPNRPNLVTVRYSNGETAVAHVSQLTLREVKA